MKSLRGRCSRFGEGMTGEMGLQVFSKNSQWWLRGDVLQWQSFPQGIRQRPEKLDRRWLKDRCIGQQVMMSTQRTWQTMNSFLYVLQDRMSVFLYVLYLVKRLAHTACMEKFTQAYVV